MRLRPSGARSSPQSASAAGSVPTGSLRMILSVLLPIRAISPNTPYRAVRATRSKLIRAEPVAALYERGKIYHVGEFSQLEDQMCSFTTGFDRKAAGYSPDRVDALVWAFTDLFPELAASRGDDDDREDETAWNSRNSTTGY